ncbi:MAG: starch-binding protein [Oscillospiraceae bacterium]|nr:starch-binding protein [Oscillospiraceae bacterium]
MKKIQSLLQKEDFLKKALSVFVGLCLVMTSLIGVFVSSASNTITVYFVDSQYWGTPNVYYWNDGPAWPGTAMTFDSQNDFGQDIYKAEIPADVEGIIFNGNGNQTVDITENITNGMAWHLNGGRNGSQLDVDSYYQGAPENNDPTQPSYPPEASKVEIFPATVNLNPDFTVDSITLDGNDIEDLSEFTVTYGTETSHEATSVPTAPGTYRAFVTANKNNSVFTGTAMSEEFTITSPMLEWLKATCVQTHDSGIKLSSAAFTVAAAASQNGSVSEALRGFKADGTTDDTLFLSTEVTDQMNVAQAIEQLKNAGVAYIVTEAEYTKYLTTLITGKQYKQTATSTDPDTDATIYYTRFVFVVPMDDAFNSASGIEFTVTDGREGQNNQEYDFTSHTYYTSMTTNNMTYTTDSENSALLVVTVSSGSDISDYLTCDYSFV